VHEGSQATEVTTAKGTASVSPAAGGPSVRLVAGERVSASPQGALTQVMKLAPPPLLKSPGDNNVLQLSNDLQVELMWEPDPNAAPAPSGYQLQVSRSRLFSTQEINSRRTRASAKTKVTSEGAFFWRVASVGPGGVLGPFSLPRRFRVIGGGNSTITDKTPPKLQLKAAFPLGGQFFTISGVAEAGVSVFINEEEADVDSNGVFQKVISLPKVGPNDVVVKAIDPAGNQTVQSQTVIVPEE
jgi:hypothetical protein